MAHIVITGAAAGIGRATAHLCSQRGLSTTLLDQDGDAVEEVASGIAASAGAAPSLALTCDVTVEDQVHQAFARARTHFGAITGLVTSAGIDRGGLIHEMPLEQWEQVLATNLRGSYLAAKYAVRDFLESGTRGSIVCISSPGALVANRASGAYAASKAGVSALVRALAMDYAAHGIRTNAVLPGATETALMWASVPSSEVAAMRQTISREVPLGRLADPREPAEAILWLLSESSSYVTGSSLVCDGGMLAKASLSV